MNGKNLSVFYNDDFILEGLRKILDGIKYILNESEKVNNNFYSIDNSQIKNNEENKNEVLSILERASKDTAFAKSLFEEGSKILDEYNLTDDEKLAIVTGDINWIENNFGKLTKNQKSWLIQKLTAEIW